MLRTFETEYAYCNEPYESANNLRYTIAIIAYTKHEGIAKEVVRAWPGLRFELVMKYQFYFRRIAAIYQLENPKKITGFEMWREKTEEEKEAKERRDLENKIRSAKAKVTLAKKQLDELRANWYEIFPVEEHPKFAATEKKLKEKQITIDILERQLNNDKID